MTRRQYTGALVVLALSGLVGGALGSWLLPTRTAFAQEGGAEKVVTAQRFRLVDANGKGRAALGFSDDGQPGLALYDEAGKQRASLRLRDGEPCLSLRNGAGQEVAELRVIRDDPDLALFNHDGYPAAGLQVFAGAPALYLHDAVGRTPAGVALDLGMGRPSITLRDAGGKDRVVVGSTTAWDRANGVQVMSPLSTVTLFDEAGGVLWQAP